ncbi:MAG TPA: protein phosphatase [Planctomycetaceae bacterium]|nr:protein phosphatase [Planctomycetaceae bacterium]|tara:strand:- start:394 stop:816 length:423 start_codon:yes stop_codon:yes gene_type:complete
MKSIPDSNLWIGNAGDVRNLQEIRKLDIRAVFLLAYEEPIFNYPRDLTVIRLPLLDGGENDFFNLEIAVRSLTSLIRNDIQTLVTCSMGMSRSPVIVSAALATHHSQPFDEVLTSVCRCMPSDVSPAFYQYVRLHIDEMR